MRAIRCSVFLIASLLLLVAAPVRAVWLDDGVPIVVEPGLQWAHQLASDEAGGAFIVWADERGGRYEKDIYIQRIDADGVIRWTVDGNVVCGADSVQFVPQLVCGGAGDAIVTWCDYRGGAPDIYVQRVDTAGVMMWSADGELVCGAIEGQHYPEIVSDGSGGAIIAWEDWRVGEYVGYDIYAQRVDALGNMKWTADGVGVCTASSYQSFQKIVADGSGGAIIVWQDTRSGYPSSDIYAQRIDSLGNVLWTADGVVVCALSGGHYAPEIISDGAGGAIVVWTDERNGNYDVFAQRIDPNGAALWTAGGVAVCTADSAQWFPRIAPDGSGGAFVAWTDRRNGDYDVFAQRIDGDGNAQWATGGIVVCDAVMDQGSTEYGYGLSMIFSDPDNAIIAWQDLRHLYYNVYAQKIDIDGNALWAANGVTVSTTAMNRTDPRLTSDMSGGMIIGWVEGSISDSDIYAQRLDQNGEPVATLLQSFGASIGDACIRIEWKLAEIDEGATFFIFRRESSAGMWREMTDAVIDRRGLSFTFEDERFEPGMTYVYRIEIEVEHDRWLLFETDPVSVPAMPLTLYRNYPNPFNPSTHITYYLPHAADVKLAVYDAAGRLVRVLEDGHFEKGIRKTAWDGRDTHGLQASSGIYFLRLKAGKQTEVRKILLLR